MKKWISEKPIHFLAFIYEKTDQKGNQTNIPIITELSIISKVNVFDCHQINQFQYNKDPKKIQSIKELEKSLFNYFDSFKTNGIIVIKFQNSFLPSVNSLLSNCLPKSNEHCLITVEELFRIIFSTQRIDLKEIVPMELFTKYELEDKTICCEYHKQNEQQNECTFRSCIRRISSFQQTVKDCGISLANEIELVKLTTNEKPFEYKAEQWNSRLRGWIKDVPIHFISFQSIKEKMKELSIITMPTLYYCNKKKEYHQILSDEQITNEYETEEQRMIIEIQRYLSVMEIHKGIIVIQKMFGYKSFITFMEKIITNTNNYCIIFAKDLLNLLFTEHKIEQKGINVNDMLERFKFINGNYRCEKHKTLKYVSCTKERNVQFVTSFQSIVKMFKIPLKYENEIIPMKYLKPLEYNQTEWEAKLKRQIKDIQVHFISLKSKYGKIVEISIISKSSIFDCRIFDSFHFEYHQNQQYDKQTIERNIAEYIKKFQKNGILVISSFMKEKNILVQLLQTYLSKDQEYCLITEQDFFTLLLSRKPEELKQMHPMEMMKLYQLKDNQKERKQTDKKVETKTEKKQKESIERRNKLFSFSFQSILKQFKKILQIKCMFILIMHIYMEKLLNYVILIFNFHKK